MARSHAWITLIALALSVGVTPMDCVASTWELIWADEFDGTSVDLTKWQPQIGTGCPNLCGWGNGELEYYRAENATVAGGLLTIEARKENFGGAAYTSARLRTLNRADFSYGRFEARAKLPTGQGLWPAFWMLPTDTTYGSWAASGEIDIMELIGSEPATAHGTIHYGDEWPDNTSAGRSFTLSSGTFHDDFHVFALEWEPTELRWYVDGQLFATQTNWYSAGEPFPAPFDVRFHMLLNVAVGGYWPGDPNASTVFPQQMVVDYVRVYREATPCEIVYDSMDHGSPFTNGWFQFNGSVGGGGIGGNTSDLPPVEGGRASVNTGWGSSGTPGFVGGFGRSRDFDLTGFTHFEMWLNPDAGQQYTLELNLQDDDNGNGSMSIGPDDEFQYALQVGGAGTEVVAGGGWQKVSIPLSSFTDDNSYYNGGNGVLDAVPVQDGGNGMLPSVVIAIIDQTGAGVSFRTDRWAFTRRAASISGEIFEDPDASGTRDAGEGGLGAVSVSLRDANGSIVATTTTNANGQYDFGSLIAGSFDVVVDDGSLPAGFVATFDPDGLATPHEFNLELACDETGVDGNFGYRNPATAAPGAGVHRDRLHGALPNPFNARTVIRYELAQSGPAELSIHDTRGRTVRILQSGNQDAGVHEQVWDGTDMSGSPVASGVYFAALETRAHRLTQRMVLLK